MKRNMLGAFTLALLVLMGTGVAFGHWQDWVYVDGYVNTGFIDVVPSYEWSYYDSFNYKAYAPNGVAWQNVTIVDSTLYIELHNVYPALCWWGEFNIENIGTVPAGLAGISAMSSNPELKLVELDPFYWAVYYWNSTDWVGPIATLWVFECINQNGGNSNICQIDPGRENALYGCVSICFMNPLPQQTTFEFDLTFEFWNWNEAPCQLILEQPT